MRGGESVQQVQVDSGRPAHRGFGGGLDPRGRLGYLSLGQPLNTLSGGERQRLKLANELRALGGVYVFDEPTRGLHPADVERLVALFDRLVDDGGTVLVIEHSLDVVARADWVIDLGPGAERYGGQVVFAGTPSELLRTGGSVTSEHLRVYLARECVALL